MVVCELREEFDDEGCLRQMRLDLCMQSLKIEARKISLLYSLVETGKLFSFLAFKAYDFHVIFGRKS